MTRRRSGGVACGANATLRLGWVDRKDGIAAAFSRADQVRVGPDLSYCNLTSYCTKVIFSTDLLPMYYVGR